MSAYVTSNPVDRYLCPNPPPTPFTTTSVSDLLPVTLNSLSHILLSSIRLVNERERTLSITHLDEVESVLLPFILMIQHTKNDQEQHWNGIVLLHRTINETSLFLPYAPDRTYFRYHHPSVHFPQRDRVPYGALSSTLFSFAVLFKSVQK